MKGAKDKKTILFNKIYTESIIHVKSLEHTCAVVVLPFSHDLQPDPRLGML